jgi:hypothetical protein
MTLLCLWAHERPRAISLTPCLNGQVDTKVILSYIFNVT